MLIHYSKLQQPINLRKRQSPKLQEAQVNCLLRLPFPKTTDLIWSRLFFVLAGAKTSLSYVPQPLRRQAPGNRRACRLMQLAVMSKAQTHHMHVLATIWDFQKLAELQNGRARMLCICKAHQVRSMAWSIPSRAMSPHRFHQSQSLLSALRQQTDRFPAWPVWTCAECDWSWLVSNMIQWFHIAFRLMP